MGILNDNALLRQQNGTNQVDTITTTAMTGKSYSCVHFLEESVVTVLTASNVTSATGSDVTDLVRTYAANSTLFVNVNTITMTSGLALGFYADAE